MSSLVLPHRFGRRGGTLPVTARLHRFGLGLLLQVADQPLHPQDVGVFGFSIPCSGRWPRRAAVAPHRRQVAFAAGTAVDLGFASGEAMSAIDRSISAARSLSRSTSTSCWIWSCAVDRGQVGFEL
jgi:hypothetical protein